MRWLVERTSDQGGTVFEDVGAEYVKVEHGCLVFRDSIFEHPTYMVAAGRWVTVVAEADE
jgi:hypothetical protein